MPIVIAVNMAVMTKFGVTLFDMISWSLGSACGIMIFRNWRGERLEGLIQRVTPNRTRRDAWVASRETANGFDRNVSSGTKRQLTVHL